MLSSEFNSIFNIQIIYLTWLKWHKCVEEELTKTIRSASSHQLSVILGHFKIFRPAKKSDPLNRLQGLVLTL